MENNDIFLGISKNSLYRLIEDPKEAEKAYESLKNYKKNNIKDAYDFFNKLSIGRGNRTYNQFTFDKIAHSLEYVGTFDYIKHKKTFNLDTKEGMELHVYRNKNQYHKAPKDLNSMKKFIDAGYFIFEGFSPCHNLTKELNNYEGRKATLSETVWLLGHKLLYRPNQYSAMHNISVRGVPGTSFEGCQFIYNYDSGKLVTDNINRGTWDYGKYATHMHFILDIYPWLQFGNGDNLEKPEMFIMSSSEEKLYFTPQALQTLNETKKHSSILMNDKTTKEEYENFLKWSNDTKGMVIVHSDEEKDLVEKSLKQAKEEFIDQQYVNAANRKFQDLSAIDMAYKDAWFDYVSFLTTVENREITQGLDKLVSYIDTDPISFKDIISDNREKERYGEYLFKTAFDAVGDKFKPGINLKVKLPISIDVHFSPVVREAIQDVKNKLGDEETVNQVKFYSDAIVTAFNAKIKKYNFEVYFNDDFEAKSTDFDHFKLCICQFRRVSEIEGTILSNKVLKLNADRFIANNENIDKTPDGSVEDLVRPAAPEYSEEFLGLSKNTSLVLGGLILSLLVGAGKIIYDNLDANKTKKLAKQISDYLFKQLSAEYDRMYKINYNIKTKIINNKIAYAFAEYDKYGVYNVYEPKDFMKKEDYIEYRSTMILEAVKAAKNYDHLLELTKDTYHDVLLLDGEMIKEVFEDTDLLDELVRFEYGDNSTDHYAREDYVKSLINQMEEKIYDLTEPYVRTEKDTKYYFYADSDAINWNRVGKEPIKNQLKFKVGYTINYNFDFASVQKQMEELIKKA